MLSNYVRTFGMFTHSVAQANINNGSQPNKKKACHDKFQI